MRFIIRVSYKSQLQLTPFFLVPFPINDWESLPKNLSPQFTSWHLRLKMTSLWFRNLAWLDSFFSYWFFFIFSFQVRAKLFPTAPTTRFNICTWVHSIDEEAKCANSFSRPETRTANACAVAVSLTDYLLLKPLTQGRNLFFSFQWSGEVSLGVAARFELHWMIHYEMFPE